MTTILSYDELEFIKRNTQTYYEGSDDQPNKIKNIQMYREDNGTLVCDVFRNLQAEHFEYKSISIEKDRSINHIIKNSGLPLYESENDS